MVKLPKRSKKGAYDDDQSIAHRRFVAAHYDGTKGKAEGKANRKAERKAEGTAEGQDAR